MRAGPADVAQDAAKSGKRAQRLPRSLSGNCEGFATFSSTSFLALNAVWEFLYLRR
jgi:hypothetical protein